MLESLIEFFLLRVVYPIVMEVIKKGDEDPEFRRKLGVVFAEWSASSTTDERRKALRDLHDLRNS